MCSFNRNPTCIGCTALPPITTRAAADIVLGNTWPGFPMTSKSNPAALFIDSEEEKWIKCHNRLPLFQDEVFLYMDIYH